MTNIVRKINFETFTKTMNAAFPEAELLEERKNFVIFSPINNVKCEIKTHWFSFGFRSGDETLEIIADAFAEYGAEINSGVVKIKHSAISTDDDLQTLIEFVNSIDDLANVAGYASSQNKKYSGINKDGLFANIATVIKAAFDTKMYDMIDRRAYDAVDEIIALNAPLETNSYREHIVPCVMITQHAFEMFDNGASIFEVATMIQQNLFIVHITKEEADYLDHTLGLKTTMPAGWEFGDSVFARLDAAGINY